jgi:hypothetical protein
MKKNTIILSNGQAATVPEGADPTVFRRLCEARINPAPAKRKPTKRTTTRTGKQSKRSQVAAMKSAVSWATVELVKRVNGEVKSPVSDSWYTVNTGEFVASVDRKTNEVSYQDE